MIQRIIFWWKIWICHQVTVESPQAQSGALQTRVSSGISRGNQYLPQDESPCSSRQMLPLPDYVFWLWFFFWIPGSVFISDCVLQALMHYAGSRNSMDHGLPLLEVYCLSINCFAAARSHLTAESDRVALVLKRLALWVLTNNPKKNIQSVYSLLNRSHQPFTWARSSVKENTVCSQFICLSLLLQAHELYSIVAHTRMRKHETIK